MKYLNSVYFKILIAVLVLVYIYNRSVFGGDFQIYLGAAELLKEGKNCYHTMIHLGGDNYCGYSYSPFFAIILIPFTYLWHPLPQLLWLLLNLVFLYRIWQIISTYLDFSNFSKRQFTLFSVFTILASLRFILHNFEMVQMTIFMVYCCLEAVYQSQKSNYFKSGSILSLGIIIKILPIVILPYFFYRKQFRSLLLTLVGIAFFFFLPALIYGGDFNNELIRGWWATINPSNPEFIADQNITGEGVHSLSGFISAFFSDTESKISAPYNRVIYALNDNTLFWFLNLSRLFLVGLTLYFLRSLPFTSFKNNAHTFWELSYILTVVPLIFPNQQKYAFAFLIPATAYVFYFFTRMEKSPHFSFKKYQVLRLFLLLFFLLSTITTDGIIGDYLNDLSEYYKTITFGTFFLIASLFLCDPKYLEQSKDVVEGK